jgi:hypothetical protein
MGLLNTIVPHCERYGDRPIAPVGEAHHYKGCAKGQPVIEVPLRIVAEIVLVGWRRVKGVDRLEEGLPFEKPAILHKEGVAFQLIRTTKH